MTTQQELELVREQGGGLLKPSSVVEFARDPKSSLHDKFEWDDSTAAEQHRLTQARQIIRVAVKIIGNSVAPVRAYVSLEQDRASGGGYRAVAEVLSDNDLRAAMLSEALAELECFRQKYETVEALRPVFAEVRKVSKKPKRKTG